MIVKTRADLHKIIDLKLPSAEVGVAAGEFSRDILNWGVPKHYMVDLWEHQPNVTGDGFSEQGWHDANYENALKLVAPFGEKAIILRGKSVEMAKHVPDESLGLVHLDACHDYQCVLNDLEAWMPKLVRGGVMSGHDFNNIYGVKEAVYRFTLNKYHVYPIPDIGIAHAGFWFKK
jgi:hypothetical protein